MSKLKSLAWKGLVLLRLTTPSRIVIALSPVITSAAGLVAALAGKYGLKDIAGVHLTPVVVAALFATGLTAMSAKLLVWLHGASKLAQISKDFQAKLVLQNEHALHQVKIEETVSNSHVTVRHENEHIPGALTSFTHLASHEPNTGWHADEIGADAQHDMQGALSADEIPPPAHPLGDIHEIGLES